ncbi:histone-lysine N-methyltransferase SETMAR-like [Nycticebus coucang]|uniref:histone-lysine N-methyltransferase SETMAR-like n=1 Tax=Nycticebus coucang TaxID=9470 RepID=UPI00234C176F|nr:histone-lysine N-methyltransferase SETMAR-like [Nycticebus coucang]XP_053428825.1 histone-lysine N-methyltransferase SETMAR-like [Nycticebus coucang]
MLAESSEYSQEQQNMNNSLGKRSDADNLDMPKRIHKVFQVSPHISTRRKRSNFCEAMDKSKIRVIFEYEFRRGSSAAQTARNTKEVFGKDVANERTVRRWFEKFRSGDFNLENKPRGRPETKVDNDELKAVVEANPSQPTQELAARFDVTIPTILDHLKQIGKVKKLDRWVPRELNECQKRNRLETCLSLLSRHKVEPFLHRIVTYDEKWILFDNRKHLVQWLDKDAVPKHSPKPNIHQKKLMVSVWWSTAGIIHYSFMKPGQSITADVYCNQLKEMMRMLAVKQLRLVNRDRPILLQDNTRPHVTQTLLKLQKLDLETLYYPPYSPDLAPTDYHFFQGLDLFLQGKLFISQQAVENAFCDFVATCSPGFFASGINELPLRWQNCVDSLGAYFD